MRAAQRGYSTSRGARGKRLAILDALLATVALYAFAGWVYVALNAIVHPESLAWPLTHFAGWPREDTFGVMCFALSFACTLARRILRALT